MYVFLYSFFKYFCYPICIVLIALEFHRYIYMRYLVEEEEADDYMEEEYD